LRGIIEWEYMSFLHSSLNIRLQLVSSSQLCCASLALLLFHLTGALHEPSVNRAITDQLGLVDAERRGECREYT
jgi:hypothetical protein